MDTFLDFKDFRWTSNGTNQQPTSKLYFMFLIIGFIFADTAIDLLDAFFS
ncbi:unnamed protein product, partial [Larinioides sclopetarius]